MQRLRTLWDALGQGGRRRGVEQLLPWLLPRVFTLLLCLHTVLLISVFRGQQKKRESVIKKRTSYTSHHFVFCRTSRLTWFFLLNITDSYFNKKMLCWQSVEIRSSWIMLRCMHTSHSTMHFSWVKAATALQSLPGTSGGRLLRALNPSISKKAKIKNFTFQKLP